MNKEPLVIYWSPAINLSSSSIGEEMLYPEPTNLLHDLIKIRNKDSGPSSFFSCPAASGRMKKTFVFRNSLSSSYHYDFTDKEGGSIVLGLRYIFFSEEPVLGYISPPMMHEPKYTKSATAIPGAFDISKWFRPFVMEVQTWKTQGDIFIEEDEPLFYFEAATEREVVLKRFEVNDKLMRYLDGCVQAPAKFGRYLPLRDRYKKFTESRMNDLVLKEIKNNIVKDKNAKN
jgi:hypothetical protein